ncbi:FkbM family methyltransferase [Sulfitobacter mediterraneus]|uniref:FkbM family methyltransferase n=1 Tax=Sulfitobacter mediterraneus TaxID=83219 RepID=UPI001939D05F|nr:FkbM family methyltransferase [Sulfitobacter mediterraneus]MBM1557237.1 FkbM family methyltransferase [Sulfitobacter mediterraneus]MBM1568283.1 FkbM family methyltransferase [Sulfitobacter mediterraneus]MBM1572114.1 FkbM family methyltransferase [Sulfitobacter mediterraneus]MBM1575903.1 FkbM family methyltransferase [Sulfitobacter mediterraneus]MBM1580225.1 FkbM family methyltransferase [Sulfitobacter mediterraneus]
MDGQDAEKTGFIRSRGMKFPKHPEIMQGKIRRLLRSNSYEAKETEAALRVVREGDVVVELGGGIGYMSTLVATKRAIKSVHVFEANPNLIPYIRSVHGANDVTNAHVTNAILGPRKGSVDFYVREPMLGSSMQVLEGEVDPPSVKVDVLNAKAIFKEIGATVLICDIEGAEVDLIPQLDLTGLRAAIIETHPQWIGPEGINKVFRAFMDAGLAYYHRGSHGKVLAFRTDW